MISIKLSDLVKQKLRNALKISLTVILHTCYTKLLKRFTKTIYALPGAYHHLRRRKPKFVLEPDEN